MTMRAKFLAAVIAAPIVLAASAARADFEADFEADAPRVFSIQERPYRLGHEFSLGLGALPLDAFYTGMVVNAGYAYHLSDFWAWEIAAGYSLNFDTGLEDELFKEYGVLPVRGGGDRIQVIGTGNLIVKPLFGKLALFNASTLYGETYLVFGGGAMRMGVEDGSTFYFTLDPGAGIRFWVGDAFSIRFDVRNYMVFKTGYVPENNLLLMLVASFNYFTADEDEAEPAALMRSSTKSAVEGR